MTQADKETTPGEPDIALLYQTCAPALLAYVRSHLVSQEDAEDLVVEVFLAAMESQTFAELSAGARQRWLWRVARNKVIDVYRRTGRRQQVNLELVADTLFEDERRGPEQSALQQEDYTNLYAHLHHLPARQQEILRMRFALGLPCRDIAQALKTQENVVRVTLSRTLNRLRSIYHARGREQGSE
jgi:RNA polymerase sigma factor (sigma-70 family)